MIPLPFVESNVVYAENQDEYLNLPCFRTPEGELTICWQLTWKERIMILLSGILWQKVLTFNQPLQPQQFIIRTQKCSLSKLKR